METKPCPHCAGSGRVLDHAAIGASMRRLRESRQISGRQMATRLKISAAYLSDLELGRRNWSGPLLDKFKRELR